MGHNSRAFSNAKFSE